MNAPQPRLALLESRRDRLIGILLICGAFACFSCLDATAKWLNKSIPVAQIVWARYFSAAILVAVSLRLWARPSLLVTRRPGLQAMRSVCLVLSTAANFIALQYLQLTETLSLSFATPFIVALVAVPVLGERIGGKRLAIIALGFTGVLVVLRPGLGALHPAAFLCILGCFFYATYNISTRVLASWDSPETTTIYGTLAGVVMLTPAMPFVWVTPPSAMVWICMGAMGLFAGLGHYLLTLAHQRAPAAILSPFMYSQLLWMLILGFMIFGDLPDQFTLIGAGIVIVSGLMLLQQERLRLRPN